MSKFHIKKNGEPGLCRAEEGKCPLGGEHFATEDQAREAYETDMEDLKVLRGRTKELNDVLSLERKEFFNASNEANYTLIDTVTGAVFSTNSVVMEAPVGDEYFYDSPDDFVDMALLTATAHY